MPLHECPHSYDKLVTEVLPGHLAKLRGAMNQPWEMNWLSQKQIGFKAMQDSLGLKSDFAGAYVLIEQGQAFYVGIARGVLKRLSQHVKGLTHSDASLAYRIAKRAYGVEKLCGFTRLQTMNAMQAEFLHAKSRIACMQVATVAIGNPLEKYLFEPFAAFELDTGQWNSFETH
jgi:hypothetical protein